MSELYGAPSGIQASIADEHTQATTRYNNSLANKMDQEAAQAQRLQELMQQTGLGATQVGTVQDPAARLSQLGSLSIQAGNVKQGAELLDKASQIDLRRTTELGKLATIEKQEFETNMKLVQTAQQFLAGATDQQSWNQSNAAFQLTTGQASPFAGMPFSEALKQTLNDGFTTTATRLTADYRQKEYDRKKAANESAAGARASTLDIRRETLKLQKQREIRLAKAGGKDKTKPAGMPSKAEVAVVDGLLDGMGLSADDRVGLADDIAQEARRLWKNNPALTPKEAAARVLMQKQESGELVPGEKQGFLGKLLNDKSGKVFSPLRPAPPPKSAAEAVKGQFYQTPRGLAKWDGSKFIPAALPRMRTATTADDEEDDDE